MTDDTNEPQTPPRRSPLDGLFDDGAQLPQSPFVSSPSRLSMPADEPEQFPVSEPAADGAVAPADPIVRPFGFVPPPIVESAGRGAEWPTAPVKKFPFLLLGLGGGALVALSAVALALWLNPADREVKEENDDSHTLAERTERSQQPNYALGMDTEIVPADVSRLKTRIAARFEEQGATAARKGAGVTHVIEFSNYRGLPRNELSGDSHTLAVTIRNLETPLSGNGGYCYVSSWSGKYYDGSANTTSTTLCFNEALLPPQSALPPPPVRDAAVPESTDDVENDVHGEPDRMNSDNPNCLDRRFCTNGSLDLGALAQPAPPR